VSASGETWVVARSEAEALAIAAEKLGQPVRVTYFCSCCMCPCVAGLFVIPCRLRRSPSSKIQMCWTLGSRQACSRSPPSAGRTQKAQILRRFTPTASWKQVCSSACVSCCVFCAANGFSAAGHDILFFWVARMVMMGLQLTDKLPFHTARDSSSYHLVFSPAISHAHAFIFAGVSPRDGS
jgi:hypothetical protein